MRTVPVRDLRVRDLSVAISARAAAIRGSRAVRIGSSVVLALTMLAGCRDAPHPPAATPTVAAVSQDDSGQLGVLINSAPTFDAREGWSEGFVKAKGQGPGVVVGPGGGHPTVFAQSFSAAPGERFKVVARAASGAGPKATARIQINWTDAGGRFLAVSSRTFEVTTTETRVEESVSAPAGAASGTLYVVADGEKSIVRYLEMRLLGGPHRSPSQAARTAGATPTPSAAAKDASGAQANAAASFPKPPNLTPLDGSGRELSVAESQYYFYQAAKALQRRARERGMDFIMYVMPDYNIPRLMPAIEQLRREGVKVLAYEPQGTWTAGVDTDWFWQQADSHWTEAAVRLTADEILYMWQTQAVENRRFSREMMDAYGRGFPVRLPGTGQP